MPAGTEHLAPSQDKQVQELYWGIRLANGSILPPPTDKRRIDKRFYLPGSSLVPVPWPPTAIALPWTNRPHPPRSPPDDPSSAPTASRRTQSPPPPIKVPPRQPRPARMIGHPIADTDVYHGHRDAGSYPPLPTSPAAARSNWRVAAAARGGASERCVRRSHTRNDAPEELPPLSASWEA